MISGSVVLSSSFSSNSSYSLSLASVPLCCRVGGAGTCDKVYRMIVRYFALHVALFVIDSQYEGEEKYLLSLQFSCWNVGR